MKPSTVLAMSLLGIVFGQASETVLFTDTFDAPPASGWRWLREDASAWRLREGALEIRVQPGDGNTVRNALVRSAPNRRTGRLAVEVTVTNLRPPTQQFEQAGLTWYANGAPAFKLVKERVDGQLMIIPGRQPMTNQTVQLRVVVSDKAWEAQFRPDGKGEYQTAGRGELPAAATEEISIQCYHGPPEAEHWIRFDNFRILRLEP